MDRRRFAVLAVVGALTLAGCTGLGPEAGPDNSRTQTPATATPTDSTATATPHPDTMTDFPDGPMTPPERPAKLNRTSAASYVRMFEYRYVYNSLWYGDASDVTVECETESTKPARDGYRVTVECYGYSNTGGNPTGTATATEVHADWGDRAVTYYVDENTTLRFDDSRTASRRRETPTGDARPPVVDTGTPLFFTSPGRYSSNPSRARSLSVAAPRWR